MTIDELIEEYEYKIQMLRLDTSTIAELVATVYEGVVNDLRQVPRVLTLDEVKSLPEETDVWVELSRPLEDSIMTATTIVNHGEHVCCSHYDAFDYDDYNKTPYGWRLWTERPSEEQMNDEKWDKQ